MNKTIILILTITLTSCQFSAKVNNEESEKEKAEVVASKFHENYNSIKSVCNQYKSTE